MKKLLRILIVEDNPADTYLIQEMMPETGSVRFQFESVERLSEAITRLEREGIDIVLLDLGLPDSLGLPTLHDLRKAEPNIPVIVLSGNKDQELAVAAVRDGAQDYLVKGQIDGNLLARAARYAVERKRMADERERLIAELQKALAEVKTLSGLLPICAGCKKIRDEKNYWHQVESYVAKHTNVTFTHGLCPDCLKRLYPDYVVLKDGDVKLRAKRKRMR